MKGIMRAVIAAAISIALAGPAFATTRSIAPRADGEGGIGTSSLKWRNGYFYDVSIDFGLSAGTLTITGAGTITGQAIIQGSATVQGAGGLYVNYGITGGSATITAEVNAGTITAAGAIYTKNGADQNTSTITVDGALILDKGVTAAGVGIIDTNGQIPALSSTYLADLSGANLTTLTAANISAGSLGAEVIGSSLAVDAVYTNAIADSAVTDAKISAVGAAKVTAGALGAGDYTVAGSVAVSTSATSGYSLRLRGAVVDMSESTHTVTAGDIWVDVTNWAIILTTTTVGENETTCDPTCYVTVGP